MRRLSTAGFFGLIWLLFIPGNANPKQMLTVGVATATFGIIFLLAVQWIAAVTQGFYMTGGSIVVVLFYIVKFIGFLLQRGYGSEHRLRAELLRFHLRRRIVRGAHRRRCRSSFTSAAAASSIGEGRAYGVWPAASASASPRESCTVPTITTGLPPAASISCGSSLTLGCTPCAAIFPGLFICPTLGCPPHFSPAIPSRHPHRSLIKYGVF